MLSGFPRLLFMCLSSTLALLTACLPAHAYMHTCTHARMLNVGWPAAVAWPGKGCRAPGHRRYPQRRVRAC